MRRVFVLILGLFLLVASVGGASAQRAGDSSREDPLPIGTTFVVDDYEITVLSINPDAEAEVLAENQFNEAAPAGDVMVMVRVGVTYTGNETGDPGWELMYKAVGSENRGYAMSDKDCGSIPEGEFSVGELFTDGTAEYNLCWMVSEDEAPTLVMYVAPLGSSDDEDTVWISLDPDQPASTPEATPEA